MGPLLLFCIILLWTPPHFWSLALYAHSDYQRAGVPMLPVAAGARATRWQILLYSVILFGVSLLPWSVGLAGPIYGFAALLLGLGFVALSLAVLTESQDEAGRSLKGDRAARRNFRYSLLYLFLLFVCVAGDRLASWHG
jgi:protoheme IX farnesyltransferase